MATLSFSDLDVPKPMERENSVPRKLQFMQPSSELSACIVPSGDPLECSVEEGVDISLSSSQNSKSGGQALLSQHLKQERGSSGQAASFKWSGDSSAFFRPIGREGGVAREEEGNWQTDEEKSLNLARPMPTIFLNDSEMRLSPQSPLKHEDHNLKVPKGDSNQEPRMCGNEN